MNTRSGLMICALLGMTAFGALAREDKKDPINKDKLVGVWEVTKSELPRGTLLEFTKEGKMSVSFKVDKELIKLDGTWSIEGARLKTVMLIDNKASTDLLEVVKLTDTELVLKDDKNMIDELKRKAPEKK
jgi:uncharacterized protein (TIGR03066 family)